MTMDWKNPNYLRNVYLIWLAAIACFVLIAQVPDNSNPAVALTFMGLLFSMPVLGLLNLLFGLQLATSHKKSIFWRLGILCFGAIIIPILLYVIYGEKKK